MIFFCEDCGEKNILSPTQLKDGQAVFRCKYCSYLNSYRTKSAGKVYSKQIDEDLNLFGNLPEIIGFFFFHRKTGVLKNNMPGILKKTDLDILGKILTNSYWVCHAQYQDVHEMVLIISNKNMIVKIIDSNLAFIIACKIFPLSKNSMDLLNRLVDQLVNQLNLYVRKKKDNQNVNP
ncbi:hypothetical protein [Desulfobacula toluolica]|uniref:Conserved uncharacterized protein n=1 Tax=Desulfobacula toluolica (strain DSM 7467 / Tol2) TaxID=651182 RepID=K0NP69_DESTT|nr:hypothetical protein [Desulfobacula toluolica]CCK80567.1 conserved uncharacterized protein [Desulfobacula toluolica Tol2]